MSQKLKTMMPELEKIAKYMSFTGRKTYLKKHKTNKTFYKVLQEISRNIIKKNIPVTPKNRNKLGRYKKTIEGLAIKKRPKKTQELIVQSGGFLIIIIPILTALLTSL